MNQTVSPERTHSKSPAPQSITAGVLIWNDVDVEGRDAFYAWHNGEHMPERMSIAGFKRARRYACPGHSPEWFTLYEAVSLDVLVSKDYLERLNNPTPATTATLKYFKNTARSVCRKESDSSPIIGGQAVVIRFDAKESLSSIDQAKAHAQALFKELERLPGFVMASLYGADSGASLINTAESRTRAFDVPVMTLMVETSHLACAERIQSEILKASWQQFGLAPRTEQAIYQLEICISSL